MKSRFLLKSLQMVIMGWIMIPALLIAQESQKTLINPINQDVTPGTKTPEPTDASTPVYIYITCQGDVNQVTDPGSCSAIVEYALPMYSGGELTVIGPPSGSEFPLGITTVFFRVTASDGQMVQCNISVRVYDDEWPEITCPPSITVVLDPGASHSNPIDLGMATATDNCGLAFIDNDELPVYPAGTTAVTWEAVDNSLNQTTCEQMIYVLDKENPVIITAPPAKTVFTDPGMNYASGVDLGIPVATDNVGVFAILNDAPEHLPVGTTTVTWTVLDAAGNSDTDIQTVTVLDGEPPVITCSQNIVVAADHGYCSKTGLDIPQPQVSDNLGVSLVSGNILNTYPVGTTAITWTVTDVTGMTSTCSQTVTVIDQDPPTIICPSNITLSTNHSCGGTEVNLGVPVVMENCSFYTVGSDAPSSFQLGTTTVNWTAYDGNNNSATCAQLVTITPGSPVTMICPENVVTCISDGATSRVINNINVVYDNTCPHTLTYLMEGATVGSGDCTLEGGISGTSFNYGVTTVTYTLTDNLTGTFSTCTFTVTIGTAAAASLTSTNENDFCNGVTLYASPVGSDYTYLWSNGQTTPFVFLALTDPPGTYSVTISDPQGCISPQTASFVYTPSGLFSSYTILAFDELQFNDYNKVMSGAVGLTGANRMAHAKKYVQIDGPGSFMRANNMNIHQTANVPNRIYSPAVVSLPPMFYNTTSGFNSTVTVPSNTTATINDNYKNYSIGSNCHITFTGNVFGKIEFDKGSTVTFTEGTLDIQEIDAKMAYSNNKSYMKFMQDAIIRVPKTVRIQENVVVNPDANHVVFYIGLNATGNPGELQVFPKGVTFNASAYVPYGQIHTEHDASTSEPGVMYGQYICNKFISNGKYVYWNWKTCEPTPYRAFVSEEGGNITAGEEMSLTVFPNPFHDAAMIEFQVPTSGLVDVTLFNAMGEKVTTLMHREVLSQSPCQLEINPGILQESGLYLVKVSAGSQSYARRIVYMK